MRIDSFGQLDLPASRAVRSTKTTSLVFADMTAALLAVVTSFTITNFARRWVGLDPLDLTASGIMLHLSMIGAFTCALFFWFNTKGHYRRRQALADQLGAVLAGSILAMMCVATTQFATVEVGSRVLTLSYWMLLAPAVIVARMVARRLLRATNVWSSPAVLFTAVSRSAEISALVHRRDEIGALVSGVCTTNDQSPDELLKAMCKADGEGATVIYAPDICDPHQSTIVERLLLAGVPFILSPPIGPVPNHAEILEFPPEDIGLIEVHDPLDRRVARAAKRAFDWVLSVLALVFFSPLLIPIALAIRSDGGPALFRQQRVGQDGRVFEGLKFRSMVMNAEQKLADMIKADPAVAQEWKAFQKLKKDPRITWVGRFIRKTNMDELPQLINVLKGDMSLVGPRPMTVPQIEEYGEAFKAYTRVRPGITGMWQVNGRNETTFEERARLDAFYVRNWSLWRDIVIIVRTVREVIFMRGQ